MRVENIECIRDIDSGKVLLPTELTEGNMYELCIRTNTRTAKIKDAHITKVSLLSKIEMPIPECQTGSTYQIIINLEIDGNPAWLGELNENDYLSTACTLRGVHSNNNNYKLQFTIV